MAKSEFCPGPGAKTMNAAEVARLRASGKEVQTEMRKAVKLRNEGLKVQGSDPPVGPSATAEQSIAKIVKERDKALHHKNMFKPSA